MSLRPPYFLHWNQPLDLHETIELSAPESQHAIRVLRLQPEDRVGILNGTGRIAQGTVARIQGRTLSVKIETITDYRAQKPKSSVAISILKSEAFSWIIEKCTELGVDTFVPLSTQHGSFRIRDQDTQIEKWQNLSNQALKQCIRPFQMRVTRIQTLDSLLQSWIEDADRSQIYFADETLPFSQTPILNLGHTPKIDSIKFLVGPEGGWSDSELKFVRGFPQIIPISLSAQVLRAETAALVCAVLSCSPVKIQPE